VTLYLILVAAAKAAPTSERLLRELPRDFRLRVFIGRWGHCGCPG
jgi:hypothetical protein